MVGRTLGHYEILELLGAGGMGEVYRARDLNLDRDVAIKVLPEELAADPERLARFEREARLLAALNHANIATIHGLETADGVRFIAMEVVEGDTLADMLAARGRIELDEALAIARRIAQALEAAHGAGVVHRDLKPANVKVTPEGNVKVLDFGLAKAYEADGSASEISPDLSHSPTVAGATRTGVIMGTAAYMSPEQARGKPVDKRADIWAFGALLYEMLSGSRAFDGETVTDVLAAVVKEEPAWDRLPAETPAGVIALLQRCLRKDPGRRVHDIADARIEIEDADQAPGAAGGAPGRVEARAPGTSTGAATWQLAGVGLTGVLLGAVLVAALMSSADGGARGAGGPTLRVDLAAGEGLVLDSGLWKRSVAISPDGDEVVFVALDVASGMSGLYRRNLRDGSVALIPGTEGGHGQFFSPDGESLGFFADYQMKTVRLDGGTPRELASAPNHWGGTWGPDGTIVYVPDVNVGLWRISALGGTPEPLTELARPGEEHDGGHWHPSFLPDGKSLLFDIWSGYLGQTVAIADLETGRWEVLIENAAAPRYVPTGHIVFGRGAGLWAVPFDVSTNSVAGPEVPVAEAVATEGGYPIQFDVSSTGVLVSLPRGPEPERELVEVSLSGVETSLGAPPGYYRQPRYSPDGTKIAVEVSEPGNSGIWIFDRQTGARTRITPSGQGENQAADWTPDGERLIYGSNRSGGWETWSQPITGTGAAERLVPRTADSYSWFTPDLSPDGRYLLGSGIVGARPESNMTASVMYAPVDNPTQVEVLVPWVEGVEMFGARMSPNGDLVAYVRRESGRQVVYVTPFPGPGEHKPVSSVGTFPLWSPDGRTLFYVRGGAIRAVDLIDAANLEFGDERELFSRAPYAGANNYTLVNWDISPDGEHFVMVRRPEAPPARTYIDLTLDWSEELNERVPASAR